MNVKIVWINIYADGTTGFPYPDRDTAVMFAQEDNNHHKCIARKKVIIEFEEGEFDEK